MPALTEIIILWGNRGNKNQEIIFKVQLVIINVKDITR